MVKLQYRFSIMCDWCDRKRACTASEEMLFGAEEPPDDVCEHCRGVLRKHGWHVESDKCLCPEHNTKSNRAKVMPQPAEGSLAAIMREVRG